METVVQPPADEDLHLLTTWGSPDDPQRRRTAGVLSLLAHVAVVVTLMLLPNSALESVRRVATHVTPLVFEPTQITPNKGPINKEFDAESMQPRPRIHIPPSPPSTTRPAAVQPSVVPPRMLPRPAPAPTPAPAPSLPEPPKEDVQIAKLPPVPTPALPVTPAPQIQAQESKPKSPFESPSGQGSGQGGGVGRVAVPNTSVNEAIRGAMRGGSGGLMVGDPGAGIGGIGEGMHLPPSPGTQGSSLELLSDPMGVDFRPYLIQVLAAVRRNWWAVMPEAARMGRRGRVVIQFAVARNGTVPKLVIASGSGTDALDRAAVVGVSASNPFPPLPNEFKGDQIRLQFNFAYNMPK